LNRSAVFPARFGFPRLGVNDPDSEFGRNPANTSSSLPSSSNLSPPLDPELDAPLARVVVVRAVHRSPGARAPTLTPVARAPTFFAADDDVEQHTTPSAVVVVVDDARIKCLAEHDHDERATTTAAELRDNIETVPLRARAMGRRARRACEQL